MSSIEAKPVEAFVAVTKPADQPATDAAAADQPQDEAAKLLSLRNFNLGLALLHIATGIIIFAISKPTIRVYSIFAFNTNNSTGAGRGQGWIPNPKYLYDARMGNFSGIFLLLAGVDHLFVATLGRGLYETFLGEKQNPFRWMEYSVSAAFMHMQIGMLSGMLDIHLQFLVFGLTCVTMLFGLLQEKMNFHLWGKPEQKSLMPFWMGFIPHIFNWLSILCYFFVSTTRGSPPKFVYAIIFIQLILDSTFAINQWLQQKEIGKWADYLHGEYVFCMLSLIAKQLLAWINYGGSATL